MNSARQHTDGTHSENTPTESMIGPPDDQAFVPCHTCGVMLDIEARCDPGDTDYKQLCASCFAVRRYTETPQTFAAKLREIGYREPVLPRDTETEDMARYLRARDEYVRRLKERSTLSARCRDLLGRIAGPLVLLAFVLLTTFACASLARGSDVPTWVLRGIAAVETGTEWTEAGVKGTEWKRGPIGEVGPWQLSPDVLRDLKAYDRRERIHVEPVFAESLTRAWLLRLYGVTNSWDEAVAAYHAGLGKRREDYAIEYAERVRAVGTTTN